MTWYGGRNCTNCTKQPLYFSPMYCSFPIDCTISVYMMTTLHILKIHLLQSIYIAAWTFFINWNQKQCSKSNILTMDHKPALENSSSTAIYTLPSAIFYFQVVQYSGHDKSCTCICEVLEIINLTNYHIWLFFNKYTNKHPFSVSWVREAILRNQAYMYFETICMSDS